MTTATTVYIPDETFRAVCFLVTGQQVTAWLPGGDWHVGERKPINVSRRQSDAGAVTAVELTRDNGATWYVAARCFDEWAAAR